MKRSATTGLVLAALLSAAALTAFLAQGEWGERILVLVCAAFPSALYLMAPAGSGRSGSVFPIVLGIVLMAGLVGLFLFSAAGGGAAGLAWLILMVWFLPLVIVAAFHAVYDRDDRLDDALEELQRRFGNREEDR
jgi:4-hydroxybenzoate polyprenyltransferase